MIFLLALLASLPLPVLAWRRTGAYAGMRAAGAGWARMAAVRALLAALGFACAAQGGWLAWQGRDAEAGGVPTTVFLVDASASMLVPDAPGGAARRDWALDVARTWAAAHPDAPVGLVEFGATAVTVTPRVAGRDALATGVLQVRDSAPLPGPEFFPGGVAQAARTAGAGGRVVLLSDGGDPEDGAVAPGPAAAALDAKKATLVAAAVGTREGGKIPLRTDAFGETQYKKFGGEDVVAKSSPERLRDFVRGAGGRFLDAAQVAALPVPSAGGAPSGTPWAAAAGVLALAAVAVPGRLRGTASASAAQKSV